MVSDEAGCGKGEARRGWNGLWSGVVAWLAERPRAPEPPPSVVITSERLRVRELTETDLEAVYAYRRDPEVLRYLERTHPYGHWEVSMFLARTLQQRREAPRVAYQLGIILEAEERLIGECCLGLFYWDVMALRPDAATFGFMLRQDCWGHGYATEAAAALLRFAFEELHLEIVHAGCLPQNTASRRVLEKLGLVYQGLQEDFPGSPPGTKVAVFQLDRQHWLTQKSPVRAPSLTADS